MPLTAAELAVYDRCMADWGCPNCNDATFFQADIACRGARVNLTTSIVRDLPVVVPASSDVGVVVSPSSTGRRGQEGTTTSRRMPTWFPIVLGFGAAALLATIALGSVVLFPVKLKLKPMKRR